MNISPVNMLSMLEIEASKFGYELGNFVGKGSFAEVFKATNKKGKEPFECVIKVVKMRTRGLKEIDVLKRLSHENITQYFQDFQNNNYIYIVMEYCNAGDLNTFLKKRRNIDESLLKIMFHHIIDALDYIHSEGLSHMDVKPENIFITAAKFITFKLGDMGVTDEINAENMEKHRVCGTYAYMAPEKLLGERYDAKIDMWSLGVVVYQCLFGKPHFMRATLLVVKNLARQRRLFNMPANAEISPGCLDMLEKLVNYEPELRISISEIKAHSFYLHDEVYQLEEFYEVRRTVELAVFLECESKNEEALAKYKAALESSLSLDDKVSRDTSQSYQQKVEELINHINRVIKRLQDKQGISITPDNSITTLKSLAVATPKLTTGIEIACYAEDCFNEGRLSLAYQKMTEALELLMSMYQTEPAGKRKQILLIHLRKWIKIAEDIKAIQDCDTQK